MQRKFRSRLFSFERLEHRSLLSGTVNAVDFGPPGPVPSLYIIGDNSNNSIVIHQTRRLSDGLVEVQVQGINTKIIGGISIEDYNPRSTGYSFKFAVANIYIDLGGGNDSLTISNTKIPGTLEIHMGSGNDTLLMSNVHYAPAGILNLIHGGINSLTVDLGMGNDVAVLRNVSSTGNCTIESGDGKTMVSLYQVSVGSLASGAKLSVELGAGQSDSLSVTACSADQAVFEDTGENGKLFESDNHFNNETSMGFSAASSPNLLADLKSFWSSSGF